MRYWSSLNRIKKIVLLVLVCVFVSLLILVNKKGEHTYSIFSIPENATPIQLERNGFMVWRNYRTSKFGVRYLKSVEPSYLEKGTYSVAIRHKRNDTTVIIDQIIYIDTLAFRLITGLEPRAYNYIQIEGVAYFVKYREGDDSMVARRLNLAKDADL